MKIRMSGLKLFTAAAAVGSLLSVASAPPALALPSYCEEQAWDFCDPYYTRGSTDWRACVKDFIDHCDYPGCIRSPSNPTQCIADKGPKVTKESLARGLKGQTKS